MPERSDRVRIVRTSSDHGYRQDDREMGMPSLLQSDGTFKIYCSYAARLVLGTAIR